MDFKIKTVKIRYSRGENTRQSSVSFGLVAQKLLGDFATMRYEPEGRHLIVAHSPVQTAQSSVVTPYRNLEYPWSIQKAIDGPKCGVVTLEAVYDEQKRQFVATMPEVLPPAGRRLQVNPRKPSKATPFTAKGNEQSGLFRERALKARTELVVALGKLDGSLYAVDKATGQEVQIIPSSLRMVAKMKVTKVEEVDL